MDSEDLIVIGALALGGYLIYRQIGRDLFEPEGTTKEGLSNITARQGLKSYDSTFGEPATYVQVGSTTYQIRDSELSKTGFIRRRAWLGNITGLDSFNWFNNWVYS